MLLTDGEYPLGKTEHRHKQHHQKGYQNSAGYDHGCACSPVPLKFGAELSDVIGRYTFELAPTTEVSREQVELIRQLRNRRVFSRLQCALSAAAPPIISPRLICASVFIGGRAGLSLDGGPALMSQLLIMRCYHPIRDARRHAGLVGRGPRAAGLMGNIRQAERMHLAIGLDD